MVYNFFDKKSSRGGVAATEPNFQLANELQKQIIRNLRKETFINRLETIFGGLT